MACEVTVLADSVAPNGARLITFEVEHWRAIHAEVLRHRSFSFSAASSRAIPGGRMIDYVATHPAGPLAWTTAKKGMQGGIPASAGIAGAAEDEWHDAQLDAIDAAERLDQLGVHKSISNRLLEPFANIRCVITTAIPGLMNFFAVRLHWDAEPAIQQLAKRMAVAMKSGQPRYLEAGEWHLPYIGPEDWDLTPEDCTDDERHALLAKVSAARCARVSYRTHDGRPSLPSEDLDLFDRLVGSTPKHASPTEHQAKAINQGCYDDPENGNLGRGWYQHRKMIAGEMATAESFSLDERLALYGENDFLLEEPK